MFIFKGIVLKSVDLLVKANFAIALTTVVAVAILALTNNEILFEDDADLYGPLANNLRLILVYLALTEVNICFYCWYKAKQYLLSAVGIFYLLMIGGLEVYSQVNQMPVDVSYSYFFLYQSISHLLFGGSYWLAMIYPVKSQSR